MRRVALLARIAMTMGVTLVGIAALRPQPAFASWNVSGSGSSYAKATTMPTGATPTGVASVRDVTVTWAASTVGGTPVAGYTVNRYTSGGALQTIGASCSGTISALTCTETAVPTGTWKYAVTPRQGNWVGTQGTKSSNVTVAAATLSFTSPTSMTSLPTNLNGNLTQYANGETITFRLDNASTGTVLAGSTVPSPITGTGTATFTVTIPAGTSVGAHTVFGVGSLGTQASAGITVVDNVAPSISSAVLGKNAGGTSGYIAQGGTYRIYANVTDPAPSSGLSSVTANVSNVTTGSTAVVLSSGNFTFGVVSYNYRSALLTASNPLAAGATTFTVTATDGSANSTTSSPFPVTVDNTAPAGADVQAGNTSGGTVGKAEAGDTLVYTFSEPIDPNSILAAWDGTSTSITVRLNNGAGASDDTITIFNAANSAQLKMGTIDLGRSDYTAASIRFTSSTMVMSGSTITITLGTASGVDTTAAATGTMIWTPNAGATDLAGNACSTTNANESGAGDKEF